MRISDKAVPIDQRRERMAGAPHDTPNLVDQRSLRDLYGHSGYGLYWVATAVYPRSLLSSQIMAPALVRRISGGSPL
jgi:hypothetical protein